MLNVCKFTAIPRSRDSTSRSTLSCRRKTDPVDEDLVDAFVQSQREIREHEEAERQRNREFMAALDFRARVREVSPQDEERRDGEGAEREAAERERLAGLPQGPACSSVGVASVSQTAEERPRNVVVAAA